MFLLLIIVLVIFGRSGNRRIKDVNGQDPPRPILKVIGSLPSNLDISAYSLSRCLRSFVNDNNVSAKIQRPKHGPSLTAGTFTRAEISDNNHVGVVHAAFE